MGLTMWKQALGVPLFDVPYGHISLYSLGPDQQSFAHDGDYSQFDIGITQVANQAGYQLKSKGTVAVGQGSGYCMEFTPPASESRELLRCAIENDRMVIFYEGDAKYTQDVLMMLKRMSHENNLH